MVNGSHDHWADSDVKTRKAHRVVREKDCYKVQGRMAKLKLEKQNSIDL